MTSQLSVLIPLHAAFALDRQLLLAGLVGELPSSYEVDTGILSFGDRFEWRADILGTESEESGTWLWAWANEASDIPAARQGVSRMLKSLGEERGIAELTEPMMPLERAEGHAIASFAVGEGLGKAYFRAPYEGGAAYLLITDDRLQFEVEEPLERILTVFPQAISTRELADHREALRRYLRHYGFEPENDIAAIVIREHGQEALRAEFDPLGRLLRLQGAFKARAN